VSAPAADLRIGVIGVGHLGRHHARILAATPGARLVGVVDLIEDRARAAVQGTSAEALTDHRALVDRVDAVTIAVPTADHLAVAEPFLEAGVAVLVEKPMAASVDDASAMMAIAASTGAILAVGHTERFNPALAAALPELRTPRFIEVHRLSGFPERSLDIDVIFDVMIHDLDIILAVDRSGVVGVEAVGVPVLTPKVDICNARIKFASGCVANITASRISRDKVRKVRFFQPDLYASVDYAAQELEIWRLRPRPGERPAIEGGRVEVAHDEPLKRELEDFVGAVRERRAPGVTGHDGLRALTLATRVAEAVEVERTTADAGRAFGPGEGRPM
jgi:predicted dehydrogenase